jgi:hypothetical protein
VKRSSMMIGTRFGPSGGLALGWMGFLAFLACAVAAMAQPAGYPQALPQPLPLFPPDNWWNADVSGAPVDPRSDQLIASIGAGRGLHPDFGGDADPSNPADPSIYGMVYLVVPGSQPLVPVAFDFGDESDPGAPGRPGGYPIPPEAISQPRWIEGGFPGGQDQGGDQHMLIVDRDHRLLFETWQTRYDARLGRWEAGSGAVFPLDGNARRPEGWTSADAAGLAILPGLIRYDEAFGADPIRHAFRVTVHDTSARHVFPASHTACDRCPVDAPPMGTRLRLKPGTDISGFPPSIQKLFQAFKTYGLIVADNGTDMYIQGTYDTRWNNDELNPAFASLHAADFEVVQLGWQPAGSPPPVPAAPGALAAAARTPRRVRLSWHDNSNDETSFHVEMRTGPGAFAEVAVVGANVSTLVVRGLTPRTRYAFRVRAANAAGFSPYSNVAAVATP